ncbi:MAG: hypothetical protein PUB10_06105 [Clostridiales bacterium]|nr:hypothetical protein [Clostridiales bacterium]
MQCNNPGKRWLIFIFIFSMILSGMCFNLSEADSYFGTQAALDDSSGSYVVMERNAAKESLHIIDSPSLHSSHDFCTGEYLGLRTLSSLVRPEKSSVARSAVRLMEVLLLIVVLPLLSFYIRNVVMWIQAFQGENQDTIIHYIHNQDGEKRDSFINRSEFVCERSPLNVDEYHYYSHGGHCIWRRWLVSLV